MKILNVISTMNPAKGGPSQGIRNSTKELEVLGIEREVVCLDDPDASFLGEDKFPIHAIGKGNGPWSYNAALIPWLLKNANRFDAIIINGLWLYHGFAVLKVIRQLKLEQKNDKTNSVRVPKYFVMPHGMLDPYFQHAPGRRLKSLRNLLFWNLLEKKIINEADGVFFTCETELILARTTFKFYKPKKEFNVGYGIVAPPTYEKKMRETFTEKCPDLKSDDHYILFLSRINEKKGVDLLIEAYLTLLTKYQNIAKLVIAGPELETTFGIKIKHLAEKSGEINKSIFFSGMLLGDAKWGALYGADCFILPSHQENFGISVAESLACGKPVLISDQVNIWREIFEGKAGIIAPDTVEGTITLIENWIQLNDFEKRNMKQNALITYQNNFEIIPAAKKFAAALFSTENQFSKQ